VSKFKAQINAHADMTEKKLARVVVGALQELLSHITTSAPGVTAGGTRIEGKFPDVSSDPIRSLGVELDGAQAGAGQGSQTVALANYDLGQVIRFVWTSEYALRIELGFQGTDSLGRTYQQPGWLMVSKNVPRWPALVTKHAEMNK
jgi:hypothetical protein